VTSGVRLCLAVGTLVSALARPGAPADQTPPPGWFGTWTLDLGRSDFGPDGSPYKRGTRTIEAAAGGAVTIVDDQVRIRGGVRHTEWTGRFDGRDYPVQGVEVALTVAYRCRDDHTCDFVQKIDGAVAATARVTMSPDGQVLAMEATSAAGSRVTLIYDKQETPVHPP